MKKYFRVSLIIVILLLSTHAFLGLHSMRFLSPTYDEHVHLTAGYSYFKTKDYRLNAFDHPPFSEMWAAVPLLFMNPVLPLSHPYWQEIWKYQYAFSDLFMYKNIVDPEKMLHAARTMILFLSLMLGLVIYFFAKGIFGQTSAYVALFLWCFSSLFIAHGTMVSTDMALTLFYFLSIYLLWLWYKDRQGSGRVILIGLALGFLLASKYSAVVVFPVIGFILLVYWFKAKINTADIVKLSIYWVVCIFAVLIIIYQFNSLPIYYWEGLKKVLSGVAQGRSAFLLGDHSISGWYYYFPVVFLLKTPLPLLILFAVALFRKKLWTLENFLFVAWPALFYFALSCYAKVNIGQRHIMPVYPFVIVFVSGLFECVSSGCYSRESGNLAPGFPIKTLGNDGNKKDVCNPNKKAFTAGAALLLLWYAYGTLHVHPWHLSYFNEIIGSSDNGYKYLTDSNVDWGQGLKALANYMKRNNVSGIYLNYFGVGDPHYYGIKYLPLGFVDNISYPNARGLRDGDKIDFTKEPKIWFAISATNIQATYYADKNAFSFLNKIPYETIIAHSILVYDMGKHPEEYAKLIQMLR